MRTKARAAVLSDVGGRFKIETLDAPEPGPDQVLVQLKASGVCHTDESVRAGALPQPLPCILGHEGAGIVIKTGEAVTDLRPGDQVVCNAAVNCGMCYPCVRGQSELCERRLELTSGAGLFRDETFIPSFTGLGTFSDHITVKRGAVVKVDTRLPFAQLALFGCAIQTGVGAALNAAAVTPGASVAVVGCGGVGQSMVQGARAAGAAQIIAVDPDAKKRELALKFGATHAVDPTVGDAVEQVRRLTNGRGADYALEAVGRADTILSSWRMTRSGGTCVAVGVGGAENISVSPNELILSARTLIASIYGSGPPARDIPRFVGMAERGQLNIGGMVTRTYPLEQINDAFDAMNKSEVVRAVLVYD